MVRIVLTHPFVETFGKYHVLNAYIKSTQTIVHITKRAFQADVSSLTRLETLWDLWNRDLILAHCICILRDDTGDLYFTTVEYGLIAYNGQLMTLT